MSNRPDDQATFLFTSIEGSAKRWEQQPQAMAAVLARHEAIIRAAAEANDGYVFQVLGDAVCIAFADAPRAAAAAIDIQRGFHNADWGDAPLQIKVALHSGAAQLRGDSYFAPQTLNRLSRILAITNPGQILLSAATGVQLISLPAGATLRDMGERSLRDIQPVRIYQLVAADLPQDFPPLRTLDARPSNLPAQASSFIGRQQEQLDVATLLRQRDTRLVTLLGPGGSGKTRLSIQVATNLLDEFDAGAFFIPLAAISDPALVASTIAQALGVKERAGESVLETLQSYLAERHMLLVLDNFEQIVAAAPLIAALLDAAPALNLLISSREPLHLPNEQEYQVPPLAMPDITRLPQQLEQLADYAAIQLFVQRAQTAQFDFALTPSNAPAVAEICARLDGLPLAIELAAARVRMLPPPEMLKRLDNRLALLTSTIRDRTTRQQSLRGMIDWSYDLLDEAEQLLFVRLAVFVGGCTVEAAEVICNANADLPIDVAAGLASLADKSLLMETRPTQVIVDQPRFAMLETIREYALEKLSMGAGGRFGMVQKAIREYAQEKLTESGEERALRHAHAQFYTNFAERAKPEIRLAHQVAWLAWLEQEHDNFRAAMSWATANDEADIALHLAVALAPFWEVRGHLSEARRVFDTLLALPATPMLHGQVLVAAASLAIAQADYPPAHAMLEQALPLVQAANDRRTMIDLLSLRSNIDSNRSYDETATQFANQVLALSQELGYKAGIASALTGMGRTAFYQGDLAKTKRLQTEALAISRELGDIRSVAKLLENLGVIKYEEHDFDGALVNFTESLRLYRELGDRQNISFTLNNTGSLAMEVQDYPRAIALLEEALAIRRDMGDKLGIARTTNNLAQVAIALGDNDKAFRLFVECITLFRQLEARREIASALERFAKIAALRGQGERAARLFGAAEILREQMATPLPISRYDEYNHDLDITHSLLADADFAAAWAQGRAMTTEQAIDYAIET